MMKVTLFVKLGAVSERSKMAKKIYWVREVFRGVPVLAESKEEAELKGERILEETRQDYEAPYTEAEELTEEELKNLNYTIDDLEELDED